MKPVAPGELHGCTLKGVQRATTTHPDATQRATAMQPGGLKAAADKVLARNRQCNRSATSRLHDPEKMAPKVARLVAHECDEDHTEKDTPEHPLKGLPLLPDDWLFVNHKTVGRTDQAALLQEYRRRWLEASEAEPVAHKQANRGRYAANIWLLGATETKGG
ncbi:hypothetical protein [Thioalkalivibrio sulfidiphilus]|uniref:hypothetical protein n=1 Tax=Thioalkalivibrio sulfidiphilus TaxID=1033854 RepID=UPI003B2EB161